VPAALPRGKAGKEGMKYFSKFKKTENYG